MEIHVPSQGSLSGIMLMDKMKILGPQKRVGCVALILIAMLSPTIRVASQMPAKDVKFKKYHLWDEFYTEGVNVGDINKDGKTDIVAGARWFEAPDWKPHNVWIHKKFDYTKGYSDSFLNFVMDVNEDGWIDLISFDFPGREVYWFENPKGEEALWKRYLIDSVASNESPMMVDVDGNGRQDLVFGNEKLGQMFWVSASVRKGKVTWTRNPVSEKSAKGVGMFAHGLGWGDVNGDSRNDIIIRGGWWEAPKDLKMSPWKFHEADLGESCAQMLTYDFDADGDNDIVSSSAHEYGMWWYEQVTGPNGQSSFITHTIDSSFSESHALVLEDINLDGLPDLVTGKRYFSHQGRGPGGLEPAVLYWFEFLKDGRQKPVWVPHLIDNNSGVGIQFVTEDMNKDGKPDIVIANKNGVFYFQQH